MYALCTKSYIYDTDYVWKYKHIDINLWSNCQLSKSGVQN